MNIETAVFLGLLQALTEFLPVSSSGHLAVAQIILADVFDLSAVPLSFDIFVHFATATATLVYVRHDLLMLARSVIAKNAAGIEARRLIGLLIVATIPAGIVGLGARSLIEASFHSLNAVGMGFIVTTVFLEVAHRRQAARHAENDIHLDKDAAVSGQVIAWTVPTLRQALIIGCAQAVAVWPGISRSGSTIATALICGLPGQSAIRFSFLMSLPVIVGAGLLEARELSNLAGAELGAYVAGFLAALLGGAVAISLLVKAVGSLKLRSFGIYTSSLAVLLFAYQLFS